MKAIWQTFSDTHSSNVFFPWFSNKYFEVFQITFCSFITFALKKLRNLVEYTLFIISFVSTFFQSFQMSVFLVVNFIKLCKTLGRSSKLFGFVFDQSSFKFNV